MAAEAFSSGSAPAEQPEGDNGGGICGGEESMASESKLNTLGELVDARTAVLGRRCILFFGFVVRSNCLLKSSGAERKRSRMRGGCNRTAGSTSSFRSVTYSRSIIMLNSHFHEASSRYCYCSCRVLKLSSHTKSNRIKLCIIPEPKF